MKTTRKKTILIALIFSLFFTVACSNSKVGVKDNPNIQSANQAETTTIVTSFYPLYIMTLNITKDIPDLKVVNMTTDQTGCLHDYQLTTNDLKTISKADFFVVNGANTENFMAKVTAQLPQLKIIEATKGLNLLEEDEHGHEGEDAHGDNLALNPHIWVSISGAMEQVQTITDQLSQLDPANKELYQKNSEEYVAKLKDLKAKMHSELSTIKHKDIITFHESFPYFAKEFGLNIVATIEREPGSEPNPKELNETIHLVKDHKIKVLFTEPQYPASSAQIVAKETAAQIYVLDPAVTGPDEADAYLKIMEENLLTLKKALN